MKLQINILKGLCLPLQAILLFKIKDKQLNFRALKITLPLSTSILEVSFVLEHFKAVVAFSFCINDLFSIEACLLSIEEVRDTQKRIQGIWGFVSAETAEAACEVMQDIMAQIQEATRFPDVVVREF